ncbi:hypothetical protein OTU49_004100 [Cherax quadricarinatus]|uniref:Uncharacterized protein n=1 Tax=Cherax quadricarinatus TaxID=27406 RepID=A0AAW0XER7_CHEQU
MLSSLMNNRSKKTDSIINAFSHLDLTHIFTHSKTSETRSAKSSNETLTKESTEGSVSTTEPSNETLTTESTEGSVSTTESNNTSTTESAEGSLSTTEPSNETLTTESTEGSMSTSNAYLLEDNGTISFGTLQTHNVEETTHRSIQSESTVLTSPTNNQN